VSNNMCQIKGYVRPETGIGFIIPPWCLNPDKLEIFISHSSEDLWSLLSDDNKKWIKSIGPTGDWTLDLDILKSVLNLPAEKTWLSGTKIVTVNDRNDEIVITLNRS
jgi:hypothetical protein